MRSGRFFAGLILVWTVVLLGLGTFTLLDNLRTPTSPLLAAPLIDLPPMAAAPVAPFTDGLIRLRAPRLSQSAHSPV